MFPNTAFADNQLPAMAFISDEIEVREKMDADRTKHWRHAQLRLPFFDMHRSSKYNPNNII
jgi:hypothetical protein